MDHISKNLPTTNESNQPAIPDWTKSSQTSTPDMERQKAVLLKKLIEQSFDVFHVYSRPPEAIPNMIKAFLLVLEDKKSAEISQAFQRWMRERSTLPTPAEILKYVEEARPDKPQSTGKQPNGKWTQVIERGGQEIAEYRTGEHLSPFEISEKYPGAFVNFKQDFHE